MIYPKSNRITLECNEEINKSLQALLNYPELESIHIGSPRKKIKYNSSIFNNFKDLTELGCDLENVKLNLPKLKSLDCGFGKNTEITPECKQLEKVSIYRCKDYENFWLQMQKLPCVKTIHIGFGNMLNLSSICELPKLEELRFFYIKNLNDIKGIEKLKKTLKRLWFEEGAGKNISDWSILGELTELQELVIGNNSKISNLHFLDTLNKLKSFRFVSVKITTKDLSPLDSIPEVAYFHTGIDKELDLYLNEKQRELRSKIQNRVKELGEKYK